MEDYDTPPVCKRKRVQKTSDEQYDIYLNEMETNEIFRRGTINPTLDPEIIKKIWERLSKKLNSCDTGPALSVGDWKTRFNNWKNTTRKKARDNVIEIKKTGGGPATLTNLTPYEGRGLNVWGRVVICGSSSVPMVGGLQHAQNESNPEQWEILELEPEQVEIEVAERAASDDANHEEIIISCVDSSYIDEDPTVLDPKLKRKKSVKSGKSLPKCKTVQSETIKMIGQELMHTYKTNVDKGSEARTREMEIQEKQLRLKIAKFEFEIAKYSFENPNFQFSFNLE